jgi:histidinol-phosphate aminotransferase
MTWDEMIREELGPMVPYAPGLRASEVRDRTGRSSVLKLSSNEHPTGPVASAVEAVRMAAPHLNRYPDGSSDALERRLSERLDVGRANLVVGNGSNEILRLVAQAVLRPGDEVVFAWPSFVVYPMVAQMFGAVAVKVPLTSGEEHDLAAISAAIGEKTRLVFLCNPNNPTGTAYPRDEFERFLADVPDDVLVVVDEAYFEYVTDASYPDALEYFDGERPLVVARTFSKIHSLAGLRVGYAVMPEVLARALDKIREPFNVNMLAQAAAYHSLGEEAEIARRARENAEVRAYVTEVLRELGSDVVPSEANFVYVRTNKPREVFEGLLDEGVIVRDFGTAPALRIGLPEAADTDRLSAALGSVARRLGGI